MNQPKKLYPILLFGLNVRRWERRKSDGLSETNFNDGFIQILLDREDEKWGPSELQKYSRFSLALTWPLCFKFSWYWKYQTPGIPGSERGLFFRIGQWKYDPNMDGYQQNKFGFTSYVGCVDD